MQGPCISRAKPFELVSISGKGRLFPVYSTSIMKFHKTVLSLNFVTSGCAGIDRWLRTLDNNRNLGKKLCDFKMPVSLEPFDRF